MFWLHESLYCVCVCVCGVSVGQKKARYSRTEDTDAVSSYMDDENPTLRFSRKAMSALKGWAISPDP